MVCHISFSTCRLENFFVIFVLIKLVSILFIFFRSHLYPICPFPSFFLEILQSSSFYYLFFSEFFNLVRKTKLMNLE